jgi:dTDP-4-dehydrorhamnose 3,5-epimerase
MSRFSTQSLPLEGLKRLVRQRLSDSRGSLTRMFCAHELENAGWQKSIAQVNHTHTARQGTVRGLHYQLPPHAEMKLISCIRGEVWDIAVDLRANSPTFLKWHAEYLTSDNGCSLLIPEGFAHGFQCLTNDVELLYFHSSAYVSTFERGINPQDAILAIDWPMPITELSPKDFAHPKLDVSFKGLEI